MSNVKVMGHVPADTDSVCSPMAYAWYLNNIKSTPAEAVVGSALNKETLFILDKLNLTSPAQISELTAEDKLVLIDSTNPKELIAGADQAQVIEVIDHHKLGGLATDKPLAVTIRPYGCVATVIFEVMGEDVRKLEPQIAGLLLAAIVSDTLNLTSPTTLDIDREAAAVLSEISGIDRDELADGMFAAKSDISDVTTAQLLEIDYKDFDFGGQSYRIACIETAKPELVLEREAEIRTVAADIKSQHSLSGVYVFVVDIVKQHATLISTSGAEADFASKAFGKAWESDLIQLPGVVSRKKQIVPAFEAAV